MDPAINLTEKQLNIIWFAARQLPPGRVPDFVKYVQDCLRPKRVIADTDITYACAGGLHRFADLQKKTGT